MFRKPLRLEAAMDRSLFIGETKKHRKRDANTKERLGNTKEKWKQMCVLLTLACSRITGFPSVGVLLRNKRSVQQNWALTSYVKAHYTTFF